MISLKRYLDAAFVAGESTNGTPPSPARTSLFEAYRSALVQMGDSGAQACPAQGAELRRGIARIDASLHGHLQGTEIVAAQRSVSELLREWGTKAANHYQQRTGEVKDLLLIMARTAESLGHKDDRYTQQLDYVTAKLESIATIDDVASIHASVEESARDLRKSVSRMAAESKAVIDHLRAEVTAYQTKLEKAEYIASTDPLTGLGSRRWMEGRMEQRIQSDSPFSILIVDIDGFGHVNDDLGKFAGDQLLKEFARELRSTCRFSDLVARWGGERFIVLLDSTGSDARSQQARLRTSILKPYQVPGRTGYVNVHLNVSIAIAECREDDTVNDLLERADAELVKGRALTGELLTA